MEQTIIPSNKTVLGALLRADFTTQWRNRKSVLLILLVPVAILLSWKGLADKLGGPFVLSNSITIGLNAIGLMGYSNAIARDRDKGIFQRLRVAPLTAWSIMVSRLTVQLAMILLVTLAVFIVGSYADKITLTPAGYLLGLLMSILSGAVYLGLGQAIVGLIKNADTVNAVSRLVYIVFIMVGMLADLGVMGETVKNAMRLSPYGSVRHLLSDSMHPQVWNHQTTLSLLFTAGYALLFSAMGIKWFKWSSR